MYHCEHICRLAFLQETMSQITSVINYMFTSMYHCEHICRLAFFLDAWIRLEKPISNIPLGLQLISRLENIRPQYSLKTPMVIQYIMDIVIMDIVIYWR